MAASPPSTARTSALDHLPAVGSGKFTSDLKERPPSTRSDLNRTTLPLEGEDVGGGGAISIGQPFPSRERMWVAVVRGFGWD
jgi:hypothetical protein